MLLYNVYYWGNSMDRNTPIDKSTNDICVIECTNGAAEYFKPDGNGGWTELTRQQFTARMDENAAKRR